MQNRILYFPNWGWPTKNSWGRKHIHSLTSLCCFSSLVHGLPIPSQTFIRSKLNLSSKSLVSFALIIELRDYSLCYCSLFLTSDLAFPPPTIGWDETWLSVCKLTTAGFVVFFSSGKCVRCHLKTRSHLHVFWFFREVGKTQTTAILRREKTLF